MKTIHILKPVITANQDLSAAPLSFTTTIGRAFKLEEVTLHADVAITETVKVTRVSANGANYSPESGRRTLVAEQDFVFRPQGEMNFRAGDEVKVECTKANNTGIVYVEILTSEM